MNKSQTPNLIKKKITLCVENLGIMQHSAHIARGMRNQNPQQI